MAERILDVVICAYGADGIRRVAQGAHPRVEGVHYVVSWQRGGAKDADIPQSISSRDDFEIYPHHSRGLTKNRNYGFSKAQAPLLLISDDDLDYTPEGLQTVIDSFARHPECGFLTFEYSSPKAQRHYPPESFDLASPPKGYYVCSVEIAMRREPFALKGILFDEDFELGGNLFNCGGEDILIHDAMQAGLKGRFIPAVICSHPTETTTDRAKNDPLTVMTKGAVLSVVKPRTWLLRALPEAMRASRRGCNIGILRYISLYFKGARLLRTNGTTKR